jgi:hypothetical protein
LLLSAILCLVQLQANAMPLKEKLEKAFAYQSIMRFSWLHVPPTSKISLMLKDDGQFGMIVTTLASRSSLPGRL